MSENIANQFSLRIRHPTKRADEIIAEIGKAPAVSHTVGDSRATPSGQSLQGVYDRTYVLFEISKLEDATIGDTVENFIAEMETNSACYLSEIISTGGEVEFLLGLFCNGKNIGFELSAELVRRLASVGIALSVDIYP